MRCRTSRDGDIHAVLLGAGRDGDPVAAGLETDVAVIRLQTEAPIVLLVPGAALRPRRDGVHGGRRRRARDAAVGGDDLVRDPQGARDRRPVGPCLERRRGSTAGS